MINSFEEARFCLLIILHGGLDVDTSITLYEKKNYVFKINVLFYKVLNKYFTIVKVS